MSRRRIGLGVLAATLVVVLVATAAAVAVVRRSYPAVDGESRLLGLEADAEVLRDDAGVPHIYASTPHDLFFLQGYVTASDRLWELEFLRRIGQGRLSELFGASTLDTDRFLRTLGIYRVARREAELLRPETKAALQAYADGVNKYVELHRASPPLEFVLLGVSWEPWGPPDSVVIGKVMAWDLGGNMQTELVRADTIARLGPDLSGPLFPGPPATLPPVLSGAALGPVPGADGLDALLGRAGLDPGGSNAWVLAPSRTTTGGALLANDPHLGLRNPSIWYLVHLVGDGLDVIGFSIPGAPGVVIGHNDRIAWGVTNGAADVQDLYVELPDPTDLRRFRFRDGYEAAEVRREEIRVRGREPVSLDVIATRHGPILTPVLDGAKQLLALRWTALEPGRLIDALSRLDRARDWQEFRAALADWDVPGQNFVYADVAGHIGYQYTGRLPIRANGDGRVPVPGWTGDHEWIGFIPYDELPSRLDPPEGVIVTANQRPLAAYRYFLGDEFDPGFRARRILDLLGSRARHSLDDLRRVQTDVRDLAAPALLDVVRAVAPRSDRARRAQELLRGWDGEMRADEAAPAVYQAWFRHFVRRVYRDKLGEPLYRAYLRGGRTVFLSLLELVRAPDSAWFTEVGDERVRGRDEVAARALEDAVDELARALGTDPSAWRWGRLHTVTFDHPLGAVPLLDRVFNLGPYPAAGDGFTVAQAGYSLRADDYRQVIHPSMRMVVDLSRLDRSLAVYPTGQSGQPFARHWGDLTRKWLDGELVPLRYSRDQLPLEGRLFFRPR